MASVYLKRDTWYLQVIDAGGRRRCIASTAGTKKHLRGYLRPAFTSEVPRVLANLSDPVTRGDALSKTGVRGGCSFLHRNDGLHQRASLLPLTRNVDRTGPIA